MCALAYPMRPEGTAPHDVYEYLAQDHDRLDALLADVARQGAESSLESVRPAFAELDGGLRRHIRLEEEILFPLLAERSTFGSWGSQVLHLEHAQILRSLERMALALGTHDVTAFRRAREDLTAVLPPHNAREERVLYPLFGTMLPPDEAAALLERLRSV